MSNIKTILNSNQTTPSNTNSLYKLQNASSGFISNSFPVRRLVRNSIDYEQAWITAYKNENKKYFEAVLTNQKLDMLEKEETEKDKKVPERKTLKKFDFLDSSDQSSIKNPYLLDGFYLMQLCCVEDPLDLSTIDISDKHLNQIKEDDMNLFDNIIEINANENSLNFESFRNFSNLKTLFLACNNIKTIRLKHEDFYNLENLDLSFNNLTPIDVTHLGILKNLKYLKLTGNNLQFLPDTFSKLYVYTKDNKKIVSQKFQNLEELFLDQNQLKEENSFDVLSVLKKLKRLHLNGNNISCIPNLKIFRKNHVFQEFNKSYYKRKNSKTRNKSASSTHKSYIESKSNEVIVKDLDRPSSEMNIHNSNTFRNSFILEEEEENNQDVDDDVIHLTPIEEDKTKTSLNSIENLDKSFELPFPELVYINLADNYIAEEDDLIAVASWPLLNNIILYGNPIVYNNVGFTPLIKQYLVDRLGINIQKIRPLKPLKVPILIPQREHRFVESNVPKVSKVPIETKMLTYYQEMLMSDAISDRSNLSSAGSVESNQSKKNSENSFDSGGHLKNDIFKPFKQDKILNSFRDESHLIDLENTTKHYNDDNNNNNNNIREENVTNSKDFNSFFMTQVDQEETLANNKVIEENKVEKNNQTNFQVIKQNDRYKNYEILFNIENEDQIKVPKDISSSVRALKQMLDNPLIIRDPCKELDKPQVPLRKNLKSDTLPNKQLNITQPKLAHVNEILDTLKERKTISEINLTDALANLENKKEYERAKKLLERAQRKYELIKQESLKPIKSPKSKDSLKFNFNNVKSTSESNLNLN